MGQGCSPMYPTGTAHATAHLPRTAIAEPRAKQAGWIPAIQTDSYPTCAAAGGGCLVASTVGSNQTLSLCSKTLTARGIGLRLSLLLIRNSVYNVSIHHGWRQTPRNLHQAARQDRNCAQAGQRSAGCGGCRSYGSIDIPAGVAVGCAWNKRSKHAGL